MESGSCDVQLRQAAFDHVNRRASLRGGVLNSADLGAGFEFDGERIPLINPQRGIFKPRQMVGLLSIRTVFPRRGGRVWYEDQREAHQQIYAGDDVVDYPFMGADPNSPDNRWLREANVDLADPTVAILTPPICGSRAYPLTVRAGPRR